MITDMAAYLAEVDRLWSRGIKVPVTELADLDRLDEDEIVAGYRDARPDDPEPGPNRSRAYWHGWRNRMREFGHLPPSSAAAELARKCVERGDFRAMFECAGEGE